MRSTCGGSAVTRCRRAREVRRYTVAPQDVPAATLLILIQLVCRSYELTLPNKLFEFAGVPMIVSDLPVMRAVVLEGRHRRHRRAR